MKKLLLVGKFAQDNNVYTYATSFYRALKQLGFQVATFNCKQNFLPMGGPDHDQLHHGLKLANNKLVNLNFKKKVCSYKPAIIFFVKAENISHKTLADLKQETFCKLVSFYPDNPFVFWNGNSNKHVLLSLPLYDSFLIWSKMLQPVLESAGCNDVYYFPFAYDQTIFDQEISISDDDQKKYTSDVCFLGTWDKQREEWLTKLCQKMPELDLAIWGNLWEERLSADSILKHKLRGKAIYLHDMIKAFRSSKIVLNFIRKQNMTSHNMRTFEVLASKGFLLTQRTTEQTTHPFEEEKNIECFDSVEELTKKIAFYLKNDTLRNNIVDAGHSVIQDFTMVRQLEKFFAYLNAREG